MKKIIHPTDFSENASKALEFAIEFALKYDAELNLLNIGEIPTALDSSPDMYLFTQIEEGKRDSTIDRLKTYVAKYTKATNINLKIEFEARFNTSTVNGIIEAINDLGAGLVVLGTKGQSKLKQLIMGSTTKALVSKAPCPVLAIPEETVFSQINQIVYASDHDPHDMAVVKRIAALAKRYDADLSVLHIFDKGSKEESKAAAFQKEMTDQVNYSNFTCNSMVSDQVGESIASFIKDNKADMLVLYEKEKKGISGLFHKGMVKQFVDHVVTIPLLSYNIHSIRAAEENQFI